MFKIFFDRLCKFCLFSWQKVNECHVINSDYSNLTTTTVTEVLSGCRFSKNFKFSHCLYSKKLSTAMFDYVVTVLPMCGVLRYLSNDNLPLCLPQMKLVDVRRGFGFPLTAHV